MRQRNQIILAIVGVFALGIFLYFKYPFHIASEKHIVKKVELGVIQPLTGELGNFGKTVLNGIRLAVDDFHERNSDFRINLHVEDSQAKSAVAVSAFNKLRDVNDVRMIIGSLTSSATLAISPIANQSKMLLMSPTASNPALSKSGPYFFRVWTSDSFDGKVAARYIFNELELRKAGVIYLNNDYGNGLKDVFCETFANMGGQVIIKESYMPDQTDFRTLLIKTKRTNVEVLYLPGHPKGIGTILKQMKELGISFSSFSCVAAEDKEFLTLAGNAANGLYFTAPAFDINSSRPEVKSFIQDYRNRFSEMPDTHAVHGYDSAAVIFSGIEKGHIDPDQLCDYLHDLNNYEGLSGDFHFDQNGDVITSVAVKRYNDQGKVDIVKIVKP